MKQYQNIEVYVYELGADRAVSQSERVKSMALPVGGHWHHCLTEAGASQVLAFLRAQLHNVPNHLEVDISHEDVIYISGMHGNDWGEIRLLDTFEEEDD